MYIYGTIQARFFYVCFGVHTIAYQCVMSQNNRTEAAQAQTTNFLLTKKELCVIFGLVSPAGRCNYPRLYTHVLTPDVLIQMGVSIEVIRSPKKRMFTAVESAHLRRILNV